MKQDNKPDAPYCRCGRKCELGLIAVGPVGTKWDDRFVRYCDRCNLMSHAEQQYYIRMCLMQRAPVGATALLSIRSRTDGMAELTYATGTGTKAMILSAHPYDQRPPAMGVNPNDVLLETWNLLDGVVVEIKQSSVPSEFFQAQGRAYANTLALMMPPFFDNADDIVREALRRYENRNNPDYETPGLGVESLKEFDRRPTFTKSQKAEPKASGNAIPEAAVATSKRAIETGMFTVKQLADSYSMTEAEVKSQLDLA